MQASSEALYQAEIFDLNGRLVKGFEVKGGHAIPVDMKAWNNGTYLVKVFNKKGTTVSKVVKQ